MLSPSTVLSRSLRTSTCRLQRSPHLSGAHHLDFRSATKDDPKWLVDQRKREMEIIQSWIDQYHTDLKESSLM